MGGVVSWLLARIHRGPVTGFGDLLVNFRTSTYSVVTKRWHAGTFAVSLNLLLTYFMVLASLRFVGLSSSDISGSEVFAAFAVSFFAGAVFPITGSGLGTVDVVMISALTTSTGNAILATAGAFLWRTFYSFITVPFGVFRLNRFRKGHGELITESWTALGEMRQTPGARTGSAPLDHLQEPDASSECPVSGTQQSAPPGPYAALVSVRCLTKELLRSPMPALHEGKDVQ
jgi:hypothetical protein